MAGQGHGQFSVPLTRDNSTFCPCKNLKKKKSWVTPYYGCSLSPKESSNPIFVSIRCIGTGQESDLTEPPNLLNHNYYSSTRWASGVPSFASVQKRPCTIISHFLVYREGRGQLATNWKPSVQLYLERTSLDLTMRGRLGTRLCAGPNWTLTDGGILLGRGLNASGVGLTGNQK